MTDAHTKQTLGQKVANEVATIQERSPNRRFGQYLYDALDHVAPHIANEIAGSDADPYYAEDKSDPSVKTFWLFVAIANHRNHREA